MHEELKGLPFELKELSEAGEFTGICSVYGNLDLGGDIVDPGAFTKTIAQRGNKVRLMDGHRVRIGMAVVEETPVGLKASGRININKQSGAEAYSDLKFYRDNGMPMGMSIGYDTLQAESSHMATDGARHLKEVRLWEVTITEFPMNEKAQVTAVKAVTDLIEQVKTARLEKKDDFDAELQEIQLYAARYQMLQALASALCGICYDSEVSDKLAASSESIQQFMDAYLGMLPDYLMLVSTDSMEWMSRRGFEEKAGRVLSQASRDLIERCVKDLQALLDAAETTPNKAQIKESGPPTGAAEKTENDENPSAINTKTTKLKELYRWKLPNSN